MTAPTQNGRAVTEVATPPVADAQALIPRADTNEAKAFRVLPPLSATEVTQLGLHRLATFLDDFTARFTARFPAGRAMTDSPAPGTHTPEAVGVGIARFMELARERQSLDAEWEFAEMCHRCKVYPAAHGDYCFTCVAGDAQLLVPTRGLPA